MIRERFAVWHELHLIRRDQPESHRRRCGIDPECGAKPVRGAPEIAAAACLLKSLESPPPKLTIRSDRLEHRRDERRGQGEKTATIPPPRV
jgi:hypothetical protein